jgi:hypothetical protein
MCGRSKTSRKKPGADFLLLLGLRLTSRLAMYNWKVQSVFGDNLNDADDVVPVATSDNYVDNSIRFR